MVTMIKSAVLFLAILFWVYNGVMESRRRHEARELVCFINATILLAALFLVA